MRESLSLSLILQYYASYHYYALFATLKPTDLGGINIQTGAPFRNCICSSMKQMRILGTAMGFPILLNIHRQDTVMYLCVSVGKNRNCTDNCQKMNGKLAYLEEAVSQK